MNDVEKTFAYQDEGLKEKREWANKNLTKLKTLVDPCEDGELKYFIQEVVDSYMMHECKLGRR